MAVAPYARGTADPRATGLAEGVADAVFDQLNKARKKDYMELLKGMVSSGTAGGAEPGTRQEGGPGGGRPGGASSERCLHGGSGGW